MNRLKSISIVVSVLALISIGVPPLMVYQQMMTTEVMNQWMLAGTIVWFIATPLWMKSE